MTASVIVFKTMAKQATTMAAIERFAKYIIYNAASQCKITSNIGIKSVLHAIYRLC